ncbi:Sporulation related domain protein [Phaeobacter italicus]|uniref:Sporulation related domain protein n=3 Tax=Phaeobacter italicus TaxID=481446 RepID=A0A0H5D1W7_9RHOB|nr:Sporulation related domain protein [Phaeobacter italicus]
MRNAGLIPTVLEQSSNGKPFWRVLVGPAQTKSERSQLLRSVKDVGFSDAYAVTN